MRLMRTKSSSVVPDAAFIAVSIPAWTVLVALERLDAVA
jgi:hypothetical protein